MDTSKLRAYRHDLSPRARAGLLRRQLEARGDSLDKLGYDDYESYLASALWQRIRKRIYVRAKGVCEACSVRQPEHIHHWSYSVETLLGNRARHLEAVCGECHAQFHQEFREDPKQKRQRQGDAWRALVASGGVLGQPQQIGGPRLVRRAK